MGGGVKNESLKMVGGGLLFHRAPNRPEVPAATKSRPEVRGRDCLVVDL